MVSARQDAGPVVVTAESGDTPAAEIGGLADLTRTQLARVVPELLLAGHLIDRASMPHILGPLGREGMTEVAIDEWLAASPIYARRMQRALGFVGDDVETIFKGMQLDIGAPPQFMDFRYEIHDSHHGAFHLDHCGALLDVEPMGPDYVTSMCHDIEDPTFDGTAAATNPRAQCRPVHRPPRSPADRTPHCEWTVTIDDDRPPAPYPEQAAAMGRTEAATVELSPIPESDGGSAGRSDYSGPLVADIDWEQWSHAALVRMAEEISLQGHMLVIGATMALRDRLEEPIVSDILRRQCAGIAGLTSERLCAALDLPRDADGLSAILAIHPALGPVPYVGAGVSPGPAPVLRLPKNSPAVRDGAWPSLFVGGAVDARERLAPLNALVRGVDARFSVHLLDAGPDNASPDNDSSDGDEQTPGTHRKLELEVRTGPDPHPESENVALTRFSGGANFAFRGRGPSLPLTVL